MRSRQSRASRVARCTACRSRSKSAFTWRERLRRSASTARSIGGRSRSDGISVARLRRAGAIVLGKTNLPQLMIWHESDNPVYGRTNNPWNLARTCGGSTGGEAAIVAARGSPLGIGNDLGGSIRVPCHFCGIHGIRPTSLRHAALGLGANTPRL